MKIPSNLPRLLSLALLVAAFIAGSQYQRVLGAPPAQTFIIAGTVTDNTGAPLADVTMVLLSDVAGTQITFTDQNGHYVLTYEGGISHSLRVTPSKSTYIFSPVATILISSSPWSENRSIQFSGTKSPIPLPFGQMAVLLTQHNSLRASALNSVTLVSEPFGVADNNNFSSDQHTRLSLFATGFELWPNEPSSVITAQAEDSLGQIYPLTIEHFGAVPNLAWLKQIVVKLPDAIANTTEVRVSITLRGVASNKVPVKINP